MINWSELREKADVSNRQTWRYVGRGRGKRACEVIALEQFSLSRQRRDEVTVHNYLPNRCNETQWLGDKEHQDEK